MSLVQQDKSVFRPPRVNGPTAVQVLDFVPSGRRSMETFLLRLAGRLHERGWRSVHVFAGPPADHFAERLRELNSPWLVAPFQPTFRQAIALGRQLRPYRPTLLQTAFMSKFHPAIPALKWASGSRSLVIGDHTSGAVSRRSAAGRLLSRLRGRSTAAYADRVVCVSDYVRRRDTHELHMPANRMRVIHNGVDLERFTPARNGTAPPNGEPVVAFVGQLISQKGVQTLLRAVRMLAEAGCPPFRVRIAGRGAQEEQLRDYCAQNGLASRVEFLGHIDGVNRFLASADVVVVPSEWEEAFGLVVSEAMACARCLLVSDVGGIPEVVGPGGEAGLVFRRGDAADLAEKLRQLLADPGRRTRMCQAARQRAVAHFSIDRMVDDYVALYEELAARP